MDQNVHRIANVPRNTMQLVKNAGNKKLQIEFMLNSRYNSTEGHVLVINQATGDLLVQNLDDFPDTIGFFKPVNALRGNPFSQLVLSKFLAVPGEKRAFVIDQNTAGNSLDVGEYMQELAKYGVVISSPGSSAINIIRPNISDAVNENFGGFKKDSTTVTLDLDLNNPRALSMHCPCNPKNGGVGSYDLTPNPATLPSALQPVDHTASDLPDMELLKREFTIRNSIIQLLEWGDAHQVAQHLQAYSDCGLKAELLFDHSDPVAKASIADANIKRFAFFSSKDAHANIYTKAEVYNSTVLASLTLLNNYKDADGNGIPKTYIAAIVACAAEQLGNDFINKMNDKNVALLDILTVVGPLIEFAKDLMDHANGQDRPLVIETMRASFELLATRMAYVEREIKKGDPALKIDHGKTATAFAELLKAQPQAISLLEHAATKGEGHVIGRGAG